MSILEHNKFNSLYGNSYEALLTQYVCIKQH